MSSLVLAGIAGLLAGLILAQVWWRRRSAGSQLERLFDHAGDIAMHACRRDGEIALWNAAAERLYGIGTSAAIGRHLHELVLAEPERLAFRLENERLCDGGRASGPYVELQARRADGSPVPVRSSALRLPHRGEYLVLRMETDLGPQRALDRALQASRARLRAAAHLPQVAVFECDSEGVLSEASPLFERLTGVNRGQVWLQAVAAEDVERVRAALRQALGGSPARIELQLQGADEPRRLRMQFAAVDDSAAAGRLVGTVEDVSAVRAAEAALRDSERKFSRIFHLMPDLVLITSLKDGMILEANEAWEPVSGWPRHEVIGRRTIELGLWRTEAAREAMLDAVAAEGGYAGTLDLLHRDGNALRVEAFVRPIQFAGEACLLGILRDITVAQRLQGEAERVRRALRASEAMFSGAFEASPDYISITRVADGSILHANEAFERVTQWPRGEALGRSTLELGLWADNGDREHILALLQRDGTARDAPARLRRRDGTVRDCLMNCAMFDLDGETCLLAIVRDVSSQREMEVARRESEARFMAFFDMAPIGLVVTDIEGRFERVNRRWCELFGWTAEDAVGHTTDEISTAHFPDRVARQRMYDELVTAGATALADLEMRSRDGHVVFVTMRARRIPIDGRECLLWSVEDVGALRAAQARIEELNAGLEARVAARTQELSDALARLESMQDNLVRAEKLAALGGLVAGIAHDLNTPIGNCVMAAGTFRELTRELHQAAESGTLRRSALESYMGDALGVADVLERGLTRASTLVSSFKQVAADQTSEQRRRFLLDQLIDEILVMLAPSLKRARVQVERDIAGELWLDSYPGPLGQVITNLVTNALAHAFEAPGTGILRICGTRLGVDQVMLEIEDNGTGIPAELQEKIFTPFFTTKRDQGGTGLGLHIVTSLVAHRLGGNVQASSTPGRGTRFVIELPVRAPADDEEADSFTRTDVLSSLSRMHEEGAQ